MDIEYLNRQIQQSNEDKQNHFDVIVLGVGSMGSSACYHLAKQGVKVLGLEQFDIPHEFGSHTGQSRIIRKAYFEHPDYVPLLERAYQNWYDLENLTSEQVYYKTGLIYFGKPDNVLMKGIHRSADKYNIQVNSIDENNLKSTYPQFNIPDDFEKLFEPDAGFLAPDKAIMLYARQAMKNDAVIKTKIKILGWHRINDGIEVMTTGRSFYAKKIIITVGAWAGKIMPALASKLFVSRQTMAWVMPKKKFMFELGKMPCWNIADDAKGGLYYGFPILPKEKFDWPIGFKIAHHHQATLTDPDLIDRNSNVDDEENLKYALDTYFPEGYQSTLAMKTCMYTNSPDENFIIDFLDEEDKNVIIATGFSGHGFKFASVVGEIVGNLAIKEKTDLPIAFLSMKRFEE